MSEYTWIVTRDSVLGDSSDAVGKIGPRGATKREPFDRVIIDGEHFRMLSADGEVQFSGYILGAFDGREPRPTADKEPDSVDSSLTPAATSTPSGHSCRTTPSRTRSGHDQSF